MIEAMVKSECSSGAGSNVCNDYLRDIMVDGQKRVGVKHWLGI